MLLKIIVLHTTLRFFENKNYLLILKKICKSLTSVLNNKLLFQILKEQLNSRGVRVVPFSFNLFL